MVFSYNGSALVAMAGDGCVGIASDRRMGESELQTVSNYFPKLFRVNDHTYLGAGGLATDVQTLFQHVRFRKNLQSMRDEIDMTPREIASMVATMLYERRFAPWFTAPVICGLDPDGNKPYVASLDSLGSITSAGDFAVGGACSHELLGVCESFWRPQMSPDELFEVLSQSLMAALGRNCVSGWGAEVVIITPDKVITRQLKTRMD